MPTVAPNASFEAVAQYSTGLLGSIGIRVIDNEGSTTMPRQTTGIAEYPAASGIYEVTLTAPGVAGQYSLVWDDGAVPPNYAIDELLVSFSAPAALTGTLYVTRDELKNSLTLSGQSYADDDIDLACVAASRAIDQACGRWFYSAAETRYFTADQNDPVLFVDDLVSVSSLAVDSGNNGGFDTTWVENTDFYLEPYNASLTGKPFDRIKIVPRSGRIYPYCDRNVKVIGTFGWSAIPPEVRQFAKIFAAKLLMRSRQAPFGVISYGMDQPIAVQISRHDPDFERLLGHLVKVRMFL